MSGPLCAIAGALAISHGYSGGMTRWLFTLPPLVYLGRVSFSVYLLHVFLLGTFASLGQQLGFFADLLLIVVVSSIAYWLIEEPGRALGRHIVSSSEKKLASSP